MANGLKLKLNVHMRAKVFFFYLPTFMEGTFEILFSLICNLIDPVNYILGEGLRWHQVALGVSKASFKWIKYPLRLQLVFFFSFQPQRVAFGGLWVLKNTLGAGPEGPVTLENWGSGNRKGWSGRSEQRGGGGKAWRKTWMDAKELKGRWKVVKKGWRWWEGMS